MKIDFDKFRVKADSALDLAGFDCEQDGGFDRDELKRLRQQVWSDLGEMQERLYAESKQSLLIVLQAMDAAGKDSTISKLTSNLNSHGCAVHSFKAPSKKELAHDFLWRVHSKVPAKGGITLFNRSHYEDVLIVKVHGWASDEQLEARHAHIENFESLLLDRGTQVVKFMLHISPEYQLQRFQQRLTDPQKHWKFNPGDLDERKHWEDYMAAFTTAIERSSSDQAPWYIVPAENRRFRDVMIASVVLEKLRAMNPQHPEPDYDATLYDANTIS